MDETKEFGTDLITWVIQQRHTQDQFTELIIMTLQNPEVQQETVNVLKYIGDQKTSQDILAQFIGNIFVRQDIKENLSTLLVDACGATFDDPTSKDHFINFAVHIINNQQVRQGALDAFVYQPASSLFGFGWGRKE